MRDSRSQPLVGYEEYRGLAKRTTAWVMVGSLAFLLLVIGVAAVMLQMVVASGALDVLGGGSTLPTGDSSSQNSMISAYKNLLQLQ